MPGEGIYGVCCICPLSLFLVLDLHGQLLVRSFAVVRVEDGAMGRMSMLWLSFFYERVAKYWSDFEKLLEMDANT